MEGRIVATLLVTMLSLTGVRCQFVFGYNVRLSTFDCTGHADGVAEIGCDGFVECKSHAIVKHICNDTEVFSRDTMTCTSISGSQSPCTDSDICTTKANGRYADLQNHCQTYYTCQAHIFYGHGYCPSGLVFDESLQLCNWENNVAPPCGSKTS